MKGFDSMLKIVKDKAIPVWDPPGLLDGILTPRVNLHDNSIEHVKAVPLCVTNNTVGFTMLTRQVKVWSTIPVESVRWRDYVDAISHRAKRLGAFKALEYLRGCDVRMGTFCHGDLSLENVLTNRRSLWLIDPLPGRYGAWSHWLDVGKIAFSLGYHDQFMSYWLSNSMRDEVWKWLNTVDKNHWHPAMISHIIRLEGYQNPRLINNWLYKELQCVF
jgi:hypothetical protein